MGDKKKKKEYIPKGARRSKGHEWEPDRRYVVSGGGGPRKKKKDD